MATDRLISYKNGGNALTLTGGFYVNAQGENAWSGADFRNAVVTVIGTGTVVLYGSAQKDPVDFSLPSTATNSYTAIMIADYSANSIIDGATGMVVANETKLFEANTNLLSWYGLKATVGTPSVMLTTSDNQ